MARLPRFYIKDQPQHIIQRGNNRELIFSAEEDYYFYLECLEEASQRHKLKIHAYVLMTNHVHLLVSPLEQNSIPKTLQSVGRKYVQYFNYSYSRTGTLWEGRYKATLIDTENYFLICMRYIELNPVRAIMVKHPKFYPWSSYAYNALGEENSLITPHFLYEDLARSKKLRQECYRALFQGRISGAELKAIRDATNKAWVFGSEQFLIKIKKLIKRRALPKTRGRKRMRSD